MYVQIVDQKMLDKFLDDVNGLHDALIRETAVLARGYVDKSLMIYGDVEPVDARIILQIQNEKCPVVDLVFKEVTSLRIIDSGVLYDCDGLVKGGTISLYPLGRDRRDSAIIEAKFMAYRLLGRDFLGKGTILVPELPVL